MLARLEPMYREILWLRFFKEKSYEEIADYCRLPLGTVKTQTSPRARESRRGVGESCWRTESWPKVTCTAVNRIAIN